MRNRRFLILSASLTAILALGALPATASAATDPLLGNDVAQPQCSGANAVALPPSPAFAVIGVNGGLANTTNTCLAPQLAWAATARGGTKQPSLAFYVNTANPALAASWWPDANLTQGPTPEAARTAVAVPNPYGTCAHDASSACAFVYGYSMALDDATLRGVPAPTTQLWWLDVETANTWQADTAANLASLEGMTAYLTGIGARVGVYSTPAHWSEIIGVVPTTSLLAALPSWRALGAVSRGSAVHACAKDSFTPAGRLSMTQYVANGFDYNVSCLKLTSAPTPKVTGTAVSGHTLTVVKRTWKPGAVTLSYRWFRDGVAIAKATHASYTVKKADVGAAITVTVTGKQTGYSKVVKTSTAKTVKR